MIAIVTRNLPIPLHTGLNLVIHNVVKAVSKRHGVKMFVLDAAAVDDDSRYPVEHECYGIDNEEPNGQDKEDDHRKLGRVAHYYRTDGRKLRWLRARIMHHEPSVVIGFGYDLLGYFGTLEVETPLILDLVDSEILFLWREIKGGRLSWGMFKNLIASVLVARKYIPVCDAVVTVSTEDTTNLKLVTGFRKIYTVPNGVDCEFYQAVTGNRQVQSQIIFTGSMNWTPNQAAVRWFLKNCWPLIRAKIPEASFVIIGKNLSQNLTRELLDHENVKALGFMPDIRDHIRSSQVSIAPMVSGSGIKNKILEAWALGKAVVATSLATRGLICKNGTNVIIADGAEAFAQSVIHVLTDTALRERLAQQGRENVVANYSWDKVGSEFEEIIRNVAART